MVSESNPVCAHMDFSSIVEVNRIAASDDDPTIIAYIANIWVQCSDCGEPFKWSGVSVGASSQEPMCSLDGYELRAPLRPASASPSFGMGSVDFTVTIES